MATKLYYNEKKKKKKNNLLLIFFPAIIILALIFIFNKPKAANAEIDVEGYTNLSQEKTSSQKLEGDKETGKITPEESLTAVKPENYPQITDKTQYVSSEFNCEYGILVDTQSNEILVSKGANEKIYPASMTKVMTLLVAVENIKNLDDTFLMTNDMLAPLYDQDASCAGFADGELVTLRDLLYGLALPSGADSAVALANYVAGGEEQFVVLMNEKAKDLGLKNTHFVNTSGLHDENHYSTPADIAVILQEAISNNLCRQILSTYQYRTEVTEQHPDGILLTSTMFSRMYGNEDEDKGVTILGGKTGYTDQAGQCLASFARKDGKEYIAIFANGVGKYSMIYDTINMYKYIN